MKSFLIIIITLITASSTGDYKKTIEEFQKEMNTEFKDAKTSPLTEADLAEFTSLDFYNINKDYNIEAELVLNTMPKEFGMKTTTDRRPTYVVYGIAKFKIKGEKVEINIYQNTELVKQDKYKDYLFLLFTDNTSGITSYAGGRYIDLRIPREDERLVIDFNKAYNPYCAYNHKYSCPIPSEDDHIEIKIEAGIKKWH
ncbi:MAG: hypothetical protein DRI86_02235 [Bacteroidetes bacterium]|nr:MAG: hypothetical protein DRI86_02235 [Bacteroidota bacterium]